MSNTSTDSIDPSFDEALRELETIVRRLEEGRVTLEEAIQSYERGMALKNLCADKLASVRLKIEQITLNANSGEPELKPFDAV